MCGGDISVEVRLEFLMEGVCGLGAEHDREVQVEANAGGRDSAAGDGERLVAIAELGKWLCGTGGESVRCRMDSRRRRF